MTWYYVYAIVPETTSLPSDLLGITGEPLLLVPCGGIAAVAGERSHETLEPSTPLIVAHHQLISRIAEETTALPVRFGSHVEGVDRLRSLLEEQHEALVSDLERLVGKVEFGITILWNREPEDHGQHANAPPGDATASSGVEYMRHRLREYQSENRLRSDAEAIRDDLVTALETAISDSDEQILPRPEMPVRASYLVNRDEAQEFLARAESLRERNSGLQMVIVGPWPPYSFVSLAPDSLGGMFGAIDRG